MHARLSGRVVFPTSADERGLLMPSIRSKTIAGTSARTFASLMIALGLIGIRATRVRAQDEPPAAPAPPADMMAPSNEEDDADRARLLGMLEFRVVTVEFNQMPAREAFATLKRLARIPLVMRWKSDVVSVGIDPDTSITYSASRESARETLEAMLALCGADPGNGECTWQLRRGFIEAGTKERLSVPAARTLRLYEIADMMIEPPTFSSDDSAMVRAFRDQIDPQHRGQRARPDDTGSMRKAPQVIAVELVGEVCETIEPGRWDFGQPIERDPDDDRVVPRPEGGPAATMPATTAPAASPGATAAPQPAPARTRPGVEYWATIRTWRQQLIVIAPDFIHRQIGGYPKPIPPEDADIIPPPVGDEEVEP